MSRADRYDTWPHWQHSTDPLPEADDGPVVCRKGGCSAEAVDDDGGLCQSHADEQTILRSWSAPILAKRAKRARP